MKYAASQKLASDLRELADFIEENGPKIPGDITFGGSYNYLYDDYDVENGGVSAKQKAKKVAKVLAKGGLVEKKHDAYSLDLIRKFGNIRMVFSINREKFCQRVVTGTKHHEARVIEAYDEEIVEWKCDDPVLA